MQTGVTNAYVNNYILLYATLFSCLNYSNCHFVPSNKELKTAICTSNAIESFNAKLKREVRKTILANLENNATIVIVNICNSYNKSSGYIYSF